MLPGCWTMVTCLISPEMLFSAAWWGVSPVLRETWLWVVPVDLGCEQPVGLRPVSDQLHGEEGGKTFLPEAELTLDLAFRLRIFSNQMADAEATEGALELEEAVSRREVRG